MDEDLIRQLLARIEQLEKRVGLSEDIEAIKALTARYCRAADKRDVDPPDYVERIAECFAEDGVWDGGAFFRAEGMEGFRDLWGGASKRGHTFVIHRTANPIITVNGDTARGLWHQLGLIIERGEAIWTAGLYDIDYVRTADGWKIKVMRHEPWLWTRNSQGWAKERFRDLATEQA